MASRIKKCYLKNFIYNKIKINNINLVKNIKTFEGWKDNFIDDTLFTSGRAKYNPHVINGTIHYKTSNVRPYYFATITKKGEKFICKIYKIDKNGDKVKIRNKIKPEIEPDDLKIAHNYVREFLNQRLKKDKEKKIKKRKDKIFEPEIQKNDFERPDFIQQKIEPMVPTTKSIIRRF